MNNASSAIVQNFRTSDHYSVYYRRWLPAGRPLARIVFLHGIRSHGGWYEQSCRKFAEAGFEVLFLDRRGSGLNTAHRGHCPGFRRLLDDVAELLVQERIERPWLPTVLAGISWGGKLAVGVAARKPGLVQGVVLLCPGLAPKIRPSFANRLRIALAAQLRPTKFFPIPLNDPELFTADPKWQHFIAKDRHGLTQTTARFLFSSAMFDLYLKRAANRLTVPSLLLLAGKDRIVDNGKTRAFVGRFSNKSNAIIDYPDSHHTLEFESGDHPFVTDVVRWIHRRVLIQ